MSKLNSNGDEVKAPFKVVDAKKFYEGTIFTNSTGDKYIVDEYNNKENVKVHFLDEHQYSCNTFRSVIVTSGPKNPYTPGKFGGYVGDGQYGRKNDPVVYNVWNHMLARIYDSKSGFYSNVYSYKSDTICGEWYNFQIFAQWYYDYLSKLNSGFKYHLDKDIYQWGLKSKVYSPDTCCLLPDHLNLGLSVYENPRTNLPTGVVLQGGRFYPNIKSSKKSGGFDSPDEAFEIYRSEKLKAIKEQADFYYSQGALLKKDYDCICNLDIKPYY